MNKKLLKEEVSKMEKCQICHKSSKDWALLVTLLSGKEIRICVNCGVEMLDLLGMLFKKK